MSPHPVNNLQTLPREAPARVLAVGAWLKNAACLIDGDTVHWSPLHGDLGTPAACAALHGSVRQLVDKAGGRVDVIAHDLHPDFESTRVALSWAERLHVPALAVQHHHAHIGVVQAERGGGRAVVGLALDGVGLGSDGLAWGGELLQVAGERWRRLGHLTPLVLPGGDVAAREPWRMAAAALHALGRGDEIERRFGPVVGSTLARGVASLIERGLNCPRTTSAGRWFDALAGLLGLSVRQPSEAHAAIALEEAARAWLEANPAPAVHATGLDLHGLVGACIRRFDAGGDDPAGAAAALFHIGLADGLAQAAIGAAAFAGTDTVALAGGCFYNRLLTQRTVRQIEAAGLEVQQALPAPGPGDAGIALGQAWVAAHSWAAGRRSVREPEPLAEPEARALQEKIACA